MKPLSPLKFFIENKRKVFVSVITIVLAVCAISLVTTLTGSLINSSKSIWVMPFKNYSMVTPLQGEYFLNKQISKNINEQEDVERLIYGDVDYTTLSLPFGGNDNVPVIFVNEKDMKYILDAVGGSLKEGRLPTEGSDEIVLHWRIMANKKLKIGDSIGSLKDKQEVLSGKYTIVGVIDSEAVISFGGQSFKEKQLKDLKDEDNKLAMLIFPKEGKRETVNSYLKSIDGIDAKCFTYEQLTSKLNKQISNLNTTLLLLISVVVIVLSISVGALMFITYTQRTDEFGILYALGYSKKYIRSKIIKEILCLSIFSWIAGMLISFALIALLNKTIYNPQGQVLTMFDIREFIFTLIIPIMVGVFSVSPIVAILNKWDPVAVIERR